MDTIKNEDMLVHNLYRIIDALEWQARMLKEPHCNNCLRGIDCAIRPEPGETARFNCPHWTDELWEQPPIIPTEQTIKKDKGFFVGVGHELKPEINDGDLVALINKVFFNKEEDGKC